MVEFMIFIDWPYNPNIDEPLATRICSEYSRNPDHLEPQEYSRNILVVMKRGVSTIRSKLGDTRKH